ncbi:hypothetical protein TIFTF001_043912 [Ficus carica]|uniref:Uncharacterized protein n=1 Tax=Ficus carica TaxID=3494 RepID=A0AA88CL59_FICCA|nr:hypothetical protein TIFTF001_043912 [Ficus carica]
MGVSQKWLVHQGTLTLLTTGHCVSQEWLVHQASCLPHHAYVTLLASPLLTSPRQNLFTKACYPPSTGHSSAITSVWKPS